MPASLLIRADASERIGTGHTMRCLALAQEFQRTAARVLFVQAETTSGIQRRLRAEGFEIASLDSTPGSKEDAHETARLAREQNAAWIVADGYHFDAEYQQHLKEGEFRLLLIDDYGHAEHYWADYILNQNISADPKLYAGRQPYTQLLLGTRYVLLRKEFEKWRDWKRTTPASARKVLITLGGSDPDNVTGKVIEAIQQLGNNGLDCVVVVGGSNPHLEKLKTEIRNSKSKIRLVLDAASMPELMAWADVAIAAGGTTSWELAFMGLPTILVVLAENQAASAQKLHEASAVLCLGSSAACRTAALAAAADGLVRNLERRRALSERGRVLVDGRGAERVAAIIRSN